MVAGEASYPYTQQLLLLDQCQGQHTVPKELEIVRSPLVLSEWHTLLQSHPDKQFVHYIVTGIEKGFRIGFSDTEVTCHSAEHNLLPASSNPEVVSKYLADVTLGRIVGPLPPLQVPGVHISPFSVIPKGHTLGKWRFIVNLSSPAGGSVNDGIPPKWCSLVYIKVDDVARRGTIGQRASLAKMDVQQA